MLVLAAEAVVAFAAAWLADAGCAVATVPWTAWVAPWTTSPTAEAVAVVAASPVLAGAAGVLDAGVLVGGVLAGGVLWGDVPVPAAEATVPLAAAEEPVADPAVEAVEATDDTAAEATDDTTPPAA